MMNITKAMPEDWIPSSAAGNGSVAPHPFEIVWPESSVSKTQQSQERSTGKVINAQIDALSWEFAIARLLGWARMRESRYVTICNVHVVVSASQDASYRDVINGSDMATPDGAPVAWMLRQQGYAGQPRISGPDLMWELCERAADEGMPVYCYGSTESTLVQLQRRLGTAFPTLKMTMESPPFRTLSAEEDAIAVARINASGAGFVFVGLGCPKQERWIAAHRGRINAVMIGVGAAFDFHAGTSQRAPVWMRDNGLEWLHRLVSEPGRLWKRYLITNTLFILGAARQLIGGHSMRLRTGARAFAPASPLAKQTTSAKILYAEPATEQAAKVGEVSYTRGSIGHAEQEFNGAIANYKSAGGDLDEREKNKSENAVGEVHRIGKQQTKHAA